MQSFYNGLSQKSREQLDATIGGSFMSLTAGKAEILMEKIAKNQSWPSSNIQSCQSEEAPEELCALSTKLNVLLNWLDERAKYKEDQRAIENAYKQDTSSPSTIQFHHNKDRVNNKVSTKIITIILPILNYHL
jgi:hypothetical protein